MILNYTEFVRCEEGVRAYSDQRVRVDRTICEYTDERGEVYRKAFEVKPGEAPHIPAKGDHKTINALQKQW